MHKHGQARHRRPGWLRGAAAALAMLAASAASAVVTIDTVPGWNGTTFISSFGIPNTQTYGQTFIPPGGATALTSFTVYLEAQSGTVGTMRGYLYAWDAVNNRAMGSALWTSGSTPVPSSTVSFTAVTFTLPSVAITAGTQYVFFAATTEESQAQNFTTRWGARTTNSAHGGGQFVFYNNGTDTTVWTTGTWSVIGEDLAFTAVFDGDAAGTVPVPTLGLPALLLTGTLLLALGGLARARRRG